MEKKAVSGIMLVLFLVGMLTLVSNAVQVLASLPVHNIDTGEYFATIQEAIDDSDTLDGHTILVNARTYYEHVTISKSLTLIGENKSTTIIDGSGSETVVSVTASNVNITGFTIRNSGSDFYSGICLASSNNTISRNNVTGNEWGIWLEHAHNNVITQNIIMNSRYGGVYLGNSTKNNISQNTITKNDMYAMWLERSSKNNVISVNTITEIWKGICLAKTADNNTISGNILANNSDGIHLFSSFNNIYENILSENLCGIFSLPSGGNIIYRNNFINNTQQVSFNKTNVDVWDNGAEGNYWSDYRGQDLNGDGIGDTDLPHNGFDSYPLIEPWSRFRIFNILLKEETHYATTLSNSTIASFNYNFSLEEVSFNVTGPSGANGFCNVTVPEILLKNPMQVLIDGKNIIAETKITRNSTHTSTYLTYSFSTHKIKISGIEPEDKIPPVASAGLNQRVNEDTPVTFNGTQSYDDVGIVRYEWTFIDGSPKTLTGIEVTYTFNTPSIYNITLTVIDASGNWDTDTVVVTVLDITKPIADAGQGKIIVEGTSVSFDASDSRDNVGIVSYEWDFGDGTTGTGISVSHTFSSPGIYEVTLTVRDEAGNISTASITVKVLSYFEVFPWWVLGVIALTGIIIGAILLWRHKLLRTKKIVSTKISVF